MAISLPPIQKVQPLSKEEFSGYVRAKGEQIKEEQAKKNNTFYNRVTGKVPLKYNVKNGDFADTTQPPDDKKGFPKAIFVINKGIELSSDAVVKIIYGAYEKQDDPDASRITKSLDLGILKILEEIAALDFCNILNTSLNKVGSLKFDPENPPQPSTATGLFIWKNQKIAYLIVKEIDDFYAVFSDASNGINGGLTNLVRSVTVRLNELLDPVSGIDNASFKDAMKKSGEISSLLRNEVAKFTNRYINVTQIPQEEVQNVLNIINQIRTVLVLLQSMSPASVVSAADILLGRRISTGIQNADQWIGSRGETLQFIKYLLEKCNRLVDIGNKAISYITLIKTFTKILLLLIKGFYLLRFFLLGTPIPASFVDTGTILNIGTSAQKAERLIDKFVLILRDINNVLLPNLLNFLYTLTTSTYLIIEKLQIMKANLEECDKTISKEIDNTVDNLFRNAEKMQAFLNELDTAERFRTNSFGNYIISIVTEELTDEGRTLKRRYGIATDNKGNVAVNSQPTFASSDEIIINEVRLLLLSKGLVKEEFSAFDPNLALTLEEALSILGEEGLELDLDSLRNLTSEFGSNDDIGLADFINNLPGGKSLRRRVRNKMLENRKKLAIDLKKTDPNSKYAKNILKENQIAINQGQIQKLEDEKAQINALMVASLGNPVVIAESVRKIKQIDAKIEALKKDLDVLKNS